jgi:hypothetical protein
MTRGRDPARRAQGIVIVEACNRDAQSGVQALADVVRIEIAPIADVGRSSRLRLILTRNGRSAHHVQVGSDGVKTIQLTGYLQCNIFIKIANLGPPGNLEKSLCRELDRLPSQGA